MTRQGILLIGGTGFLGTALARALAREGREVHVLARGVQCGQREGVFYHRGAQDDADIITPLLRCCDVVVHLAANSTPGSPSENLVAEVELNLLPVARLLDIMSSTPPSRLLFISSGGSLYGNPQQLPVGEQQCALPISAHAAGKASLEAFFNAFSHGRSVNLAILRPSNLYGPGQPLRAGFGIVRTLMEKARLGEVIEIRGDGCAVRDYLYIDDAVDACRSLIDNPHAKGAFNAGSGTGVSINTLISLCSELTGLKIRTIHNIAPKSDVQAVFLDSSRLTAETGWRPLWSLEEGLRTTWSWLNNA